MSSRTKSATLYRMAIAILMTLPTAVTAQTVEEVVVTGFADRQLLLDTQAVTGSRLGLSVRETPAILDVVTEVQMLERGLRTSVEAFNAAPGVSSANVASQPGVLSMRGFTGGAISLLHDGTRLTTSAMVTRNLDSWGFERIEVLKGPSSVLYGEGALAGTVNMVPKRARTDSRSFAWLVGGGSFDAWRAAVDANVPVSDDAALRFIGSYSSSDSHIDDSTFATGGATLSGIWRASDALTLELAVDYYADDYDTSYWGTPLVPASLARDPSSLVKTANGFVLDRAMDEANYNVADGVTDAEATWIRSRATWNINGTWTLRNELNYYDALRRWHNSERYAFASGLLTRDTTLIEHDHQFWSDRVLLSSESSLAGRRNRFSIGAEYSSTDFFGPRRFGNMPDPIDPYGAERGRFPTEDTNAIYGTRQNSEAFVDTTAIFAENAFSLTSRWLLVAGLRYEQIELDRIITDLRAPTVSTFGADYDPFSWRIGTTFDLLPKTQVFAQYSNAVIPVSTVFLMPASNVRFDLSTGESVEAGIKSSLWDERIDITLSAFRIEQDDILTRDPANSNIVIQGGSQSSQGVEVSLSAAITQSLRLDASVAAIDAQFDELFEPQGPVLVSRNGNTPPNVSETVAGLFAVYRFAAVPLTASVGARYASHFYTDNANSIRVEGYTTVDASIGYRLFGGELTVRGRNLTDELYATWAGASATQVLLGAPRGVDVSFTGRF